ncbi:MAG: hypothetical protein OZ921_01900 [Sorangiineae bacterium]|nr:hypothetical protein [Polyangiaceae bacterium]MEB2321237.1 hypothetical protein [Sorangiineae bacterium]
MSRPEFVVPIADLEHGPKRVVWPLPEGWLRAAFAGTDAQPAGSGELDATLTLSGREVVVQGAIRATVTLPDSLTLEPVSIALAPELTLLLAPAPEPAARAHRGGGRSGRAGAGAAHARAKSGAADPAAKTGKPGGWSEDPELTEEDASRDTYGGERVVLDDFAREFLLLELPMTVRGSGLPSEVKPAIAPPSEEPPPIDPRLAPLAAIASRLRQKKE